MKQFILIILGIYNLHPSFAQVDSVFLSINSQLFTTIQIVTPDGEYGIRENYTYFKYRYWLGEADTISMSKVYSAAFEQPKKKEIAFHKVGNCDSVVNKIRNRAQYWQMRSEVNKAARHDIGYDNIAFKNLTNSESYQLRDFSKKCNNDFRVDISKLQEKLFEEIRRIKSEKHERYSKLKAQPESIDSIEIDLFLRTFDLCEIDLNCLELIILQNPSEFVTAIDKMSDDDFFRFTLKLNNFSEGFRISEMKETLKEAEPGSKRKKKVIRTIKLKKGSK